MHAGNPTRDFTPRTDAHARPLLRIEDLSKRFGAATAIDRLSLDVHDGEFFALLGPSGCGKTTLLRLIAGFEHPDAGRILLDGVDLAAVPPHRRPLNMMFQSHALFPHLDIEANVGFGLKHEGLAKRDIAERVADMLAMVKLEGLSRRKPHELTGGQQQRVALARTLIKRPRVLLLDAPLAALDRKLREQACFELMELKRQLNLTVVMATPDQSEAMIVADRVGVMDRGELIQVAPPAEIYEQPNSRFVADFVGDINLLEGRAGDDGFTVEGTAAGRLSVAAKIDAAPGATVFIAVRPEKLRIHREPPSPQTDNCADGTVTDLGYLGDLTIYKLRLGDGRTMKAAVANTGRVAAHPIGRDERVWVSFAPEAAVVLRR